MSCDNENEVDFHKRALDSASHQPSNEYGRGNYRSSGSRDMLLPNVFVQIPANHLVAPPPPVTKGPVARNYDEIKAEPPIKSEIENVQQQSLAGQRFSNKDGDQPADNQFQRDHFADGDPSNASPTTTTASSSSNLVTARPKSTAVKCFKCQLCPFMSISQLGYDGHMANVHANQSENGDDADKLLRKKILCPGCANVFYSKKSLKIHLANDHQMSSSEIKPLLESLCAQAKKLTSRKQKIYLKNFEILKSPQFSSRQFARHENVNSGKMISNGTNVVQPIGDFLLDETHLNGEFSQTENRMCDLIADLEPTYSLADFPSVAESASSISDSVTVTPDDTMSVRPDSGSSIKYCDNLAMSSNDGWSNGNNNLHFQCYEQPTSNWNFISEKTSTTDTTSPIPSMSSFGGVCQNEKKKIFIKNIDILKEPLITPTNQSLSVAESTSGRKHMLHLRTVDEVNLMLSNKVQCENSSYPSSTEVITLDEDDYQYVLNDGVDYNTGIIPQYLDSDMNDLVSNYLTTPDYMPNYVTPSAYSLTNLDAVAPVADADGVIVLDSNVDKPAVAVAAVDQQRNSDQFQFPMPFHDRSMNVDGAQNVTDYDFLNTKYIQPRTPMDGPDYLIVCSDEIIDKPYDTLDLTNDEVDQIIDSTLIGSQCFDGFTQATHEIVPQTHRARINVVGNLMRAEFANACDDENHDEVHHTPELLKTHSVCGDDDTRVQSTTGDATSQAKKRSGRPKGARKTFGVTSKTSSLPYKCRIENCAMRFASESVLAQHEQCHDTTDADAEFRCPKCELDGAEAPKKWIYNTLATHLWREHSIDLELYSCTYPDCNFKTPILSRLKNTHMKIHSDTKDFKCDLCDKAFKNSKQLKNHRRIHSKVVPIRIRKCPHCGQSYSAHYFKEHLLTHVTSPTTITALETTPKDSKEYHCDECSYHSFDRNAFRRHRMVHSKQMKYKCPLCTFQAIQSANYKTHVIKKHPDSAKELIFMCDKCNFVTVNKNLYYVHCLNHNTAFMC